MYTMLGWTKKLDMHSRTGNLIYLQNYYLLPPLGLIGPAPTSSGGCRQEARDLNHQLKPEHPLGHRGHAVKRYNMKYMYSLRFSVLAE
jgi:hypothetical protein